VPILRSSEDESRIDLLVLDRPEPIDDAPWLVLRERGMWAGLVRP
jgi:hypothetical protein